MKLLTESAKVGLRHCCFDQSSVMTLITHVAMPNYYSYLSYCYDCIAILNSNENFVIFLYHIWLGNIVAM